MYFIMFTFIFYRTVVKILSSFSGILKRDLNEDFPRTFHFSKSVAVNLTFFEYRLMCISLRDI